jgi:spore germination protein GerM
MNACVTNLDKLGAPKVNLGSSSRKQHNDVSRKGEKAHILNSSSYLWVYILTWNHSKMAIKYVDAYTKRKATIRNVWVPKALTTNLKGPNSNWYQNTKLKLVL